MARGVQVRGARKLQRVGDALRQAGSKELKKEFYVGLNRAVKPLRETAKKSPLLQPGLPRRGGLAEQVHRDLKKRGGVKTKRVIRGRRPRISITAQWSGHDIAAMNRGRLRHPVFGSDMWVNQRIPAGFFNKPMEKEIPVAAKEVNKVLKDVAKKIKKAAR